MKKSNSTPEKYDETAPPKKNEDCERAMPRSNNNTLPAPRGRTVYRYIVAVVSVAVLIFVITSSFGWFNRPDDYVSAKLNETGENETIAVTYDPKGDADEPGLALTGLPVDNFSLADIHTGEMKDRVAFLKLGNFFSSPYQPRAFVFARVTETRLWEDADSHYSPKGETKQSSSVHVISILWSGGIRVPDDIEVAQSMFGGCCAGEPTNLLRKHGVYLLPLGYSSEEGCWQLVGDLDAQFEIDDKGRVFTHSGSEDFMRFDGMRASALEEAIVDMTSDENFDAAITPFGLIARRWGVLIEATVLSESLSTGRQEGAYLRYEFGDVTLLSTPPNDSYTYPAPHVDELSATALGTDFLEVGGRYLLVLDPSDDGPYLDSGRAAKIDPDGVVTAISPGFYSKLITNLFYEFNGYTATQLQQEARRAIAWHERYA